MRRALLVIAVLVSGCTRLPPLQANQVAAAGDRWPGTTDAMLVEGQRMYSVRCSACHSLYQPDALKKHDWDDISDEMVERAKLTPHEQDLVFRYLYAATIDPITSQPATPTVAAHD
jgi:cytochrome c5